MRLSEFSDRFDTLLNSFSETFRFGEGGQHTSITLDEYEKSVFLTEAQDRIVTDLYSGNNSLNLSFEEKEEVREALDSLVRTQILTERKDPDLMIDVEHLDHGSYEFTFFEIPSDLLYIIFEEVKLSDDNEDCAKGRRVLVVPSTHDELWHRLNNPFRGPNNNRVLRLNASDDLVELVSNHPIGSYTLRYVEEPQPIVLIDLPDGLSIKHVSTKSGCGLPQILHGKILDLAVRLALQSKGIGLTTGNTSQRS